MEVKTSHVCKVKGEVLIQAGYGFLALIFLFLVRMSLFFDMMVQMCANFRNQEVGSINFPPVKGYLRLPRAGKALCLDEF